MTALVLGLAVFMLLYLLKQALLALAWVALLIWNLMVAVPAVRVMLLIGAVIVLVVRAYLMIRTPAHTSHDWF
jgi:hypothetical protein